MSFIKNHKLGIVTSLTLVATLAFCVTLISRGNGSEDADDETVSENSSVVVASESTEMLELTDSVARLEEGVIYSPDDQVMIETSVEEADRLAAKGDYEGALQHIEIARESYPEASELIEKQDEYSMKYAEQMKVTTMERCDSLASEGDYLKAAQMLRECMDKYGEDEKCLETCEFYTTMYKQDILLDAADLAGSGDDISAIRLISTAVKEVGDDPELETASMEYETSYISGVMSDVDERLADKDYDGAEKVLKSAMEALPGNQKLKEALKNVESSRPKSLMAVCPPYNNVNCICNSGTDTISMAGQTYINSIFIGENIYDDSRLDFNLNGKYSSITFDVGHVDGSGTRNREMKILYNEQLVKTVCLSGTGLPQSVTLDVSGVDQLTLIIPTGLGLFGDRACYGIVNAYIYPETTSISDEL